MISTHEARFEFARQVASVLSGERFTPSLAGVYLIGSVARGEDSERSDVDLVVTHEGSEETFPYPFLDAILATFEQNALPLRPPRTRRSEKYAGAIHLITRSETNFRNPPTDENKAAHYWATLLQEAIVLHPTE